MSESRVQYTGTGTLTTFSVTFPYLDRTHVRVYVDGAPTPFTWDNDGTIRLASAPASGSVVTIQRQTPLQLLIDFTDGSNLTADELDLAYRHNLYAAQERATAYDEAFVGGLEGAQEAIDNAVQEVLNSALLSDLQARIGDIDLNAETILQEANDRQAAVAAEAAARVAAIQDETDARLSSVANLQSQINALQSATAASIFIQPDEPVPGVGGVPDPIPQGARWYDEDDGYKAYIWDDVNLVWVDTADPQIAQNQADITALDVRLADAEGETVANANAINVLDTTVANLDGTVVSISQDLTALESTVNDPSTGLAATGSALNALTTRVTAAEGTITSHSSDISALESTVNDPNTGVLANAGATDALETRVTSAEGSISSQASRITSLESEVDDPVTGLDASASAINGLDTRVTAAEGTITTHSAEITALESTVNDPATGVAANAQATDALDTRVTAAEGSITAQASDITALQSDLQDETNARSTAIQSLDTRVTDAEGDISAQASALSVIQTEVDGNSASVQTLATSVDGLEAQYSIKVDANGRVAGIGLSSGSPDNPTSEVTILADKFSIVDPAAPGGTPTVPFVVSGGTVFMQNVTIGDALISNLNVGKLESGTLTATIQQNADINVGTGRIIFDNGTYLKASGVGFGSANQFIEWFGPRPTGGNLALCTEANAVSYLKTNGDAYFGGNLSAGVLYNAAQTTSLTSLPSVEVGPFGTNGASKTVVVSYSYFNQTVRGSQGSGTVSATVVLERSLNGGSSWTQIGSWNVSGSITNQAQDFDWLVTVQMGDTFTVTDTSTSTSNFMYRTRLTARSAPYDSIAASQTLSVASTEE